MKEIESLLDPYIDACLSYGPPNMRHWWCDGIIHLEFERTAPDAIKLFGVAWITASRIAPFEIDVEFDPGSERFFAQTIFRIGARDEQGRPALDDYRRHTDHYIANRPRHNRDWAMAVALTPPPEEKGEAPAQ